jgi:hypothetical protein
LDTGETSISISAKRIEIDLARQKLLASTFLSFSLIGLVAVWFRHDSAITIINMLLTVALVGLGSVSVWFFLNFSPRGERQKKDWLAVVHTHSFLTVLLKKTGFRWVELRTCSYAYLQEVAMGKIFLAIKNERSQGSDLERSAAMRQTREIWDFFYSCGLVECSLIMLRRPVKADKKE